MKLSEKIFIITVFVIWSIILFTFIRYEANRAVEQINKSTVLLLETYQPTIVEE